MAYERIDWVGKEDSSFVEGSSPAISAKNLNNLQDGIEERILRSGDTMTGALKLYGTPTSDNEAVTKKYVDDIITFVPGDQLIASADLTIKETGHKWAPNKNLTYLLSKNVFLPRASGYIKGEITVPRVDFSLWKAQLSKKVEFSESDNVILDVVVKWEDADKIGEVDTSIEYDSAIWGNNDSVIYKETNINVYENLTNTNSIVANSQVCTANLPVFKNKRYGANMYIKFTSYKFGGIEDKIGTPYERGVVFTRYGAYGLTKLYMGNSILQIE